MYWAKQQNRGAQIGAVDAGEAKENAVNSATRIRCTVKPQGLFTYKGEKT
jgi:hypothetical protein